MMKNPNKTAGNWGALKNKPQNLVPFKKGGTTKETDMKKQLTKKQAGGPTMKTRTVNRTGSYRTVEKMKGTPSSMKQSSKTTRTAYGIMKGAPKYKNVIKAPARSSEPMPPSDSKYMKKGGSIRKYQTGGNTAADKVAEQRAINAKRKADAQARTEKAKADARAKIDQAQKNKPVVKPVEPVEPVAPAVTPNRRPESEYRTVTANPKIATIEMYDNKKVLRDSDRTRKNGNRVVVQKTKEGDTVTRTKKVYNPSKETLTTKTKTYERGDRKATKIQTKNTTSTKPKPIKPIWGDPHTLKKGGSVKKYQAGGSMIKPSPYMDRATKAKMNSPKTRDLEAQMKKAADRRGFYDSIKPTPKKKK